jgi:hypothetical protein
MTQDKAVKVRYTHTPPNVDGYIEEVWNKADSAYGFIQFKPYEKSAPTEKTVAYVLQDKENLYIAFRCYTKKHRPAPYTYTLDDYVTVYIDPFWSRKTAYFFRVMITGEISDGMVLADGRIKDPSWDGVWYRGVRQYDNRYEVEIKIPFKSIHYEKELYKWGINFKRYSAHMQETDYWTEVLLAEGDLVSKYGSLRGVNPMVTGYYFEIYPELFVRYDEYADEDTTIKPSASLNVKWDVTPQMTFNATAFPDFAQIEADPFTLNLSRYEILLEERRPFFLEGQDVFRMSELGTAGLFSPIDIFYSRRIGKAINNKLVDIMGGLKFVGKLDKWDVGVLGAYTDSLRYGGGAHSVTEPRRGFGAVRVRHKLHNADIGMLASGTAIDRDDYNYVVGIDGVYRRGFNQIIVQGAMSDYNRKRDWAIAGGYSLYFKNFLLTSHAEVIRDSFDVSEIGYVPWSGRKKFELYNAYWKIYKKGFMRDWSIGPGVLIVQEPGDTLHWSKVFYLRTWPSFRSGWELFFNVQAGPYYEANTNFLFKGIRLELWNDGARIGAGFGSQYNYRYNYYRGFLAYYGTNWLWFRLSAIPRMSFTVSSNLWVEWDTLNTVMAMTPMVTPRLDITVTKDITLGIFDEMVMSVPGAEFSMTEVVSNRIGVLLSWNFLPKSWFYIAFNDYRVADEFGQLQLQYRIGAIKAKYLLYF